MSHPAYHLGIPELDTDHDAFIDLLDHLSHATDEAFPPLFQQLVDHVRLHFVHEGRLMRIGKFAALGEHEGEHHRLFGELLQFNRSIKRGRLSLARAYVRTGLKDWFHLHYMTMDSALAMHVKAQDQLATADAPA